MGQESKEDKWISSHVWPWRWKICIFNLCQLLSLVSQMFQWHYNRWFTQEDMFIFKIYYDWYSKTSTAIVTLQVIYPSVTLLKMLRAETMPLWRINWLYIEWLAENEMGTKRDIVTQCCRPVACWCYLWHKQWLAVQGYVMFHVQMSYWL